MSGAPRRLGLAFDLLRAEGPRGLTERLADRLEALRARLRETSVPPDRLAREAGRIRVLDVLSTPPEPRWGGVPIQLLARRAAEERLRPTALLFPGAGRWTLRIASGGRRRRAVLGPVGGGTPCAGPGVDDAARAEVVLEAARLVGASVLNVEGAAGWHPATLRRLSGRGLRVVLSLHDFALFCPRPNLVEEPRSRFCGYSTDAGRCRACLAATWSVAAGFVEGWRRESAALLAAADAVVYASGFLLERHTALFPGRRRGVERVVEPPAPGVAEDGAVPATRAAGAARPAHVAFVGAFRPHKGALVFLDLAERREIGGRHVRWSVLGSGDAALAKEARRRGACVAGHYRSGSLVRRLREEAVDVALLLSVWPESYSLTLTECRAAGVPVVALDHGAIAERIAAEGGGVVVPEENGVEGIAGMLDGILSGRLGVPPFRGGRPGATGESAARERGALYEALLGEEP